MSKPIKPKKNLYFNSLLCILGNILVILPPYNYLQKESRKKCWYKWYATFIVVLLTSLNALSLWGRFTNHYQYLPTTTLIVTDVCLNISVFATNIFAILAPTFIQFKHYETFKAMFLEVDNGLNKFNFSDKIEKSALCSSEIWITHVIVLVMTIYDGYVWITGLGFHRYCNYIFRYFQTYHMVIMVLILRNICLSMNFRFEKLNGVLREVLDFPSTESQNVELCFELEKYKCYKRVNEIGLIYERLITQITLFNKIFGCQLLFLTLAIMMGFLNAMDATIVFIFIPEGFAKTDGSDLIILNCLCSLWQLVLGTLIAVSCNRTSSEAQRTADICFNILLKLPTIFESKQEKAMRDELMLLNQIVLNRCPIFSAAGFFAIDYRLLLAIFGSVTSYVIVLIQFNK